MNNLNLIEVIGNDSTFEMIFVEGGTFMMGSEDAGAYSDEKPVHEVSVSDFFVGQYLVTQEVWKLVMKMDDTPSQFKGNDRPVEQLSWNDTHEFIKKLNKLAGRNYRLLSEAEWEYAACGGKLSRGFKYAGSNEIEEIAWHRENSNSETQLVGLKAPNELGLYDMSGNVWEWVEDQWHSGYEGAPRDGTAWVDGEEGAGRVLHGGGCITVPSSCRPSCRLRFGPTSRNFDIGFRLGLSAPFR